jgi:hypothetical protein
VQRNGGVQDSMSGVIEPAAAFCSPLLVEQVLENWPELRIDYILGP